MGDYKKYLLPGKFKFLGIIIFIAGLFFSAIRFRLGIKPEFLNTKVFAVYSSYLETKSMQFVRNNLGEELTIILLICGLFFMAFAREKDEFPGLDSIRLKAFVFSAYLNLAFILGSTLFTFGFAFLYMTIANLGFFFLAYLFIFRTLIYKFKKKTRQVKFEN